MTQVSKYPVKKEIEERIFEVLTDVVAGLKDGKEINEFLDDFLSPVERVMLAKRLSIAVMLAKGYEYKEIREILHVTPPTIATVNILLKYRGRGYRKVVEKVVAAEKMDGFWKKLDDVLDVVFNPAPPKGGNWSDWRKQKENRKLKREKAF